MFGRPFIRQESAGGVARGGGAPPRGGGGLGARRRKIQRDKMIIILYTWGGQALGLRRKLLEIHDAGETSTRSEAKIPEP